MSEPLPRAPTGITGLDCILGGGLARKRLHLVEGNPGTGKTTLALQFLMAGAAAGETGIYITLAETENELRAGAKSHGWTINPPVEIFELEPPPNGVPSSRTSCFRSRDANGSNLGRST